MMWAGHLVRMEAGQLPKRAEAVKQRVRRKKGRLHISIKRGVRKVGGGENLPIEISGKYNNRCSAAAAQEIISLTPWKEDHNIVQNVSHINIYYTDVLIVLSYHILHSV